MGGGTALASRPLLPARGRRLVVFSAAPDLPGWVRGWCSATGRELCAHRVGAGAPGRRPAPVATLVDLVTAGTDPVLVVPPDHAGDDGVTVALHALPADAPVLTAAAGAARHLGGRLVLVHGLPLSFAERSVGMRAALADARALLETASRRIRADAPDLTVETWLRRVHPYELVGEDTDSGLLVVGGSRRADVDGLGPVTGSALHHATCPVLVVPR